MKYLFSLIFMLPLMTGCAIIPPFVSYISTGASALSYVATGKGTSDHVISAVYDEDCALHRFVSEEDICIEYPKTVEHVDDFEELHKQTQIDVEVE